MAQDFGTSICEKLDLSTDELNSLYVTGPVNSYVGTVVAASLVERFQLDAMEPLGAQLHQCGILTEDEANWFDDAE